MDRRQLLKTTLGAGAALGIGALPVRRAAGAPVRSFQLKYAPHFGMFKHSAGEDLIDQLQFMADQGFTALEDNGMPNRPVEVQEKIAQAMTRLGMTMGVFVADADFQNVTFASDTPEARERVEKKAKAAVEIAKRVNAKWMTVVPGRYDEGLEWDYQTAYVVDNLKRFAEILEPHGSAARLCSMSPTSARIALPRSSSPTGWWRSWSPSTPGATTPASSSRRSPRPTRSARRWEARRARS